MSLPPRRSGTSRARLERHCRLLRWSRTTPMTTASTASKAAVAKARRARPSRSASAAATRSSSRRRRTPCSRRCGPRWTCTRRDVHRPQRAGQGDHRLGEEEGAAEGGAVPRDPGARRVAVHEGG
eukprot:3936726-Prymnesium_polylepis.1